MAGAGVTSKGLLVVAQEEREGMPGNAHFSALSWSKHQRPFQKKINKQTKKKNPDEHPSHLVASTGGKLCKRVTGKVSKS